MTDQVYANNAKGRLNAGITAGALTFTLGTGEGAKFPTTTGNEFFLVTMYTVGANGEQGHEIIKCSGRTGDTFTVAAGGRGQEGTTPTAWGSNTPVECRITKGTLDAIKVTSATVATAGAAMDTDFTSQGLIRRGATPGSYSIVADNSANWNTAFSWGNHAGLYAAAVHNHDAAYAPLVHTHSSLTSTLLTNANDLDTVTTAGQYHWNTTAPTNNPSGTFKLMNVYNDGGQPVQVVFGGVSGTASFHMRRRDGGIWQAWEGFSKDTHVHSIANITSLQSTLDGKEPSIGAKGTAFNKNFAGDGAATTVSRSDHSHPYTFSTLLSSANNLNDLTVAGIYHWNSSAPVNAPSGTNKILQMFSDGFQMMQVVFGGISGQASIHMRRRDNGTWQAWQGFSLDTHGHAISEITSLQSTLDGKEPTIGAKGTAFNKSFAGSGAATTVARSDHNHSGVYATVAHAHAATDITSGTFASARISQASVTQHQAALSITESQISDLGATVVTTSGGQSIAGTTTLNDLNVTTNVDAATGAFTTSLTVGGAQVVTTSGAFTIAGSLTTTGDLVTAGGKFHASNRTAANDLVFQATWDTTSNLSFYVNVNSNFLSSGAATNDSLIYASSSTGFHGLCLSAGDGAHLRLRDGVNQIYMSASSGVFANGIRIDPVVTSVTTNQTITNTTVMTNINGLNFQAVANSTYEVEIFLKITTPVNVTFDFTGFSGEIVLNGFSVSSSPGLEDGCVFSSVNSGYNRLDYGSSTWVRGTSTTVIKCMASTTFSTYIMIRAMLKSSGTGTTGIRLSQETANASSTTILPGSYMAVREVI